MVDRIYHLLNKLHKVEYGRGILKITKLRESPVARYLLYIYCKERGTKSEAREKSNHQRDHMIGKVGERGDGLQTQ